MTVIAFLTNRKFEGPNAETQRAAAKDSAPSSVEDGTLEAMLVQRAVVAFRSLPGGVVSRYLNSTLNAGGTQTVYPSAFDAVLFIESTTNARLLRSPNRSERETLKTPANLDFEELDGRIIKAWEMQGGQARFEYETGPSDEETFEGNVCGMIRRRPGRPFGRPVGRLFQSVKAETFRDRTLAFRAAARADSGTARLWLSIDVRKGKTIYLEREVASEEWRKYRIETQVPPNASKINYGLAYFGTGRACIDAAAVEIAEMD